ncbi:MAG TPA: hypothetical protein VGH28_21105 [Polyangiaceae bacterium]|jgi:hypothetical protein
MRTLMTSFLAFVLVAACGGSQTQPSTAGQETDAAAPPASASAAPVEDAGPPKPTIESQREPFITTCMHKMTAQNYCSCAFDQFKDVFKDADLSQKPSTEQLESLRKKTIDNCASKLTDAEVKPNFTTACVGAEPRKQAYCDCAWSALRKKLEPADFVSDFEGPKFDDAKKSMVTVCKGKLPEQVAKEDFLGGCGKAPGQTTKTCECTWKKLRAHAGPEQIAAGLVDLKPAVQSCATAK